MSLTYTTIQHQFRKDNNLSLNEYIICDMVYFLSTNPSSKVPGWCWMSRGKMAEEIGISKRQIQTLITKLVEDGFLFMDAETFFLKPTSKWSKLYFKGGEETAPPMQKLHGGGEETAPHGGEETSPNNNRLDNNREKNESEDSICVSLIDKAQKIFSEAGLKGQFFSKMKSAHGLSDLELKNYFSAWRIKHQNLTTEFRTAQHLKNSFNRFLYESKNSGGKQVPVKVTGGRLIG